jgi:cytoskeletal protein RodZ
VFEIGNSLREARLRQNLDLTDAELSTKIRSKYLRALEEEQFALLPAQTYVKGFLRTYAEWLGLDGQLYVDEYNSRYVGGEDELALRPRRSAAGTPRRRSDSNAVLYALTGIVAVTALVIVAWKYGGPEGQQAIPQGTTQPVTRVKNPAPSIVVRAVGGDSYIIVRTVSAAGKQVFAGTIERGKSEHFTSRRLWFDVQLPANVRVTVNGKTTRIPRSGTAQEFIVTRKGAQLDPR